jgi:hypothetical protein
VRRLGGAFGERYEDLGLFGEASLGLLREHEVAVNDDVELALRALDDARVDAAGLERGRETRGPAVVAASDGAVVDLDAHGQSLAGRSRLTSRRRPCVSATRPTLKHTQRGFSSSPTKAAVDVPTPWIGLAPDDTSSTYTPGER